MSQYHEDKRSSEYRNRRHNHAPYEHNESCDYSDTENPPPCYPTSEYRSPYELNRYDSIDSKRFSTETHLPKTYPFNHIREEDIHSTGQSGSSHLDSIILGVIGVFVTGGFGGIGLAIALATARAATLALYTAGAGATVVGTGYVVVQGGRLVISQTKPGIVGTLRAYNKATRDVRAATASANQAVIDTTAAARIVQSGLTSQAEGIAQVSDQAINQMVNGLNQLSNLPARLENMLMAAISNRGSDPTLNQETAVVGEKNIEWQTQIRMEELEDDTIELSTIPKDDGDLGKRVDVALPTNVGLSSGSTLEQDVSRRRPLDRSDIDNVDGSDADISLAHASASEQDQVSLTDSISFVTVRQFVDEEGDFEMVEVEME